MIVRHVENVHEALSTGMDEIDRHGVWRESRGGRVLQFPRPVATVYAKPEQRVEMLEWRDSNPFFHFYESLWMMAGRRDVAPLTKYVKRMRDFSDDGRVFNAAYGWRWRHKFDQIHAIVTGLRRDPTCRQQVLQIWDKEYDLATSTKDHACNVAATFQVFHAGQLDMTLFCRSNDMIWGAYGANAVHFSVLHEYVARACGMSVGVFTQISVNLHVYESVYANMMHKRSTCSQTPSVYYSRHTPHPLFADATSAQWWLTSCANFVRDDGRAPGTSVLRSLHPYFTDVALPIVAAHDHHVDGDTEAAVRIVSRCAATDWRSACVAWLSRRLKRADQ